MTRLFEVFADYKKLLLRDNVINYVIGVGIGAAYLALVQGLVKGMVMPIIYWLLSDGDGGQLKEKKWVLCEKQSDPKNKDHVLREELALGWGIILETIINFLLVTSSLYVVIHVINQLGSRNLLHATPPEPSGSEKLLIEIRDLLKQNGTPRP